MENNQSIDLRIVEQKLNQMLSESPVALSSLLNIGITVSPSEAMGELGVRVHGDTLLLSLLSLLSSMGDGQYMLVPAQTGAGAMGVKLVPSASPELIPVNIMQEENNNEV